ncbi:DNA polymerase delta, subunit 4-domain-containing protein [Crucibulum laeve]|uniref:DNA polymerase delta, subunit 4-domain-containing protein n=1 Tax=Crucibulum laeve TaxID=68775 RepID=A0A5C3M2U9_9AGAR|nr:DNA polymerase delta, subunit 4-domain-containing protein [Crucibulum laeve]
MAPKGKSQLKQGTLQFTTAKRTTSISGKPKAIVTRSRSTLSQTRKASKVDDSSSDEDDLDDIEFDPDVEAVDEVEDFDEVEDVGKSTTRPITPASTSATQSDTRTASNTVNTGPENLFRSKDNNLKSPVKETIVRPELNDKDLKWRKIYGEAREVTGSIPLIHAEDQNKIHAILRVFDMTYKYGPCVGMTRLERWGRAKKLGLNPPQEIYDILNTREGTEKTEYSESAFYGIV